MYQIEARYVILMIVINYKIWIHLIRQETYDTMHIMQRGFIKSVKICLKKSSII